MENLISLRTEDLDSVVGSGVGKVVSHCALSVLAACTVNRGELVEVRPPHVPPPAIERKK